MKDEGATKTLGDHRQTCQVLSFTRPLGGSKNLAGFAEEYSWA
jgi:hypothetical protein